MKFVFIYLFSILLVNAQTSKSPTLPPVPPVKINIPGTPPPLLPPYPIRDDKIQDDGSGDDDAGAEDDDNVILEGILPCASPQCLGNILFEARNANLMPKEVDVINAALIREAFRGYSYASRTKTMIDLAREHLRLNPSRYIVRRKGKKTITFCYRAVKDAMRESGMVPINFNGSAVARNGVVDLKAAGFKNMLDDPNFKSIVANRPELAPKGAILIYETTPPARASIAGHAEIKTQDPGIHGYISISESYKPTYGYAIPQQRRLIGVMYKE